MKSTLLASVMALPLLCGTANAGSLDEILKGKSRDEQLAIIMEATRYVDVKKAREGVKQPHHCSLPVISIPHGYAMPVNINDATRNYLQIDTGYSGELMIPQDWIPVLAAHHGLSKADKAGPTTRAHLADGSVIEEASIIVREVDIPSCTAFYNVHIDIGPVGSTPLIGHGILSKFRFAGVDQEHSTIELIPFGAKLAEPYQD